MGLGNASQGASDIVNENWVLRFSPVAVRPYLKLARIDRPIGTWLLLFPCFWSLGLALAQRQELTVDNGFAWRAVILFSLGALVMRGAGCTFNDIVDRDFDARVARTAERPIPSGQISVAAAIGFLLLQLLVGLLILVQFNSFAIWLGIASLALVFIYPFMKRVTFWPQTWLGLAFNWGALLAWGAVNGRLDWPAILLYIAGIAWTLGYDTIYAHQDKEDDALVGIKSTALRLGDATKPWLVFFCGTATAFFLAAGCLVGLTWPFWAAMLAIALHFAWQITTLRIDDPNDCLAKFNSNRFIGWIFLAGILGQAALDAG